MSFISTKEQAFFGQLTYLHGMIFADPDNRTEHLSDELHKLAAAVELYALSFDIFDDLEDQDNLSEPWMQIPMGEALNLATMMYSISLQMIAEMDRSGELTRMVNDYSIRAMEGQHEDLTGSAVTEEACLEMMKRKSGSMLAMSSMLGTVHSYGSKVPEVHEYTLQIGIAAQTENDFRDLFQLHKSDLTTKKNTLALLYLKREFNEASQEILQFIDKGIPFEEQYSDMKMYKDILFKSGVIHYLNVIKQIAIQKAITTMNRLPLSADRIEIIKSHLIK
ncbi:isoprenyl transferase [Bacillus sp. FJAT-42376]|uniref:polyprenyl synthetase family protein n=1 Tax=Bacillus sp. FJAT-42376 TaxID=2014076 RepID=UPI000F4E41FF|nr:polyprenyl synthetase family protein [Bacillus sp. FJAT-42376]AZB44234.1 isoprenyl transferase [Bacillus sp. FJAT-42376]